MTPRLQPDFAQPSVAGGAAQSAGERLWPYAVVAIVAVLAAALRISRLETLFPILVDEAIYLRWAEIIHHQGEWFVSLLDGKQPLSYWMLAALRICGPADPLTGARLLSVAAGTAATASLGLFAIRLCGRAAGCVAALLYAVMPYALLYDRIAYTDSLVNLFGILVAWSSFECFASERPGPYRIGLAAAALGTAVLIKSTALQFGFFPLSLGVLYLRRNRVSFFSRLAIVLGVPAILLCATSVLAPEGPRLREINPVVHRSDFFTPVHELFAGGSSMSANSELLAGYLAAYVTWPLVAAAICGVAYLAAGRKMATLTVIFAGLAPLLPQLLLLRYFPGRYVFPHMWPLLLACACLATIAGWAGRFVYVLVLLVLCLRASVFLAEPAQVLHWRDSAEFLSSGPYSGYGVREAALFLLETARTHGPFVLLTDPWWGPPADAMFAYLNEKNGVRVTEAWWLQDPELKYPLLPAGRMPLLKSQYQRIEAGVLDFASTGAVYYVTDTSYRPPGETARGLANAPRVAVFPKRDGSQAIEVYRLK